MLWFYSHSMVSQLKEHFLPSYPCSTIGYIFYQIVRFIVLSSSRVVSFFGIQKQKSVLEGPEGDILKFKILIWPHSQSLTSFQCIPCNTDKRALGFDCTITTSILTFLTCPPIEDPWFVFTYVCSKISFTKELFLVSLHRIGP